MTTQSFTVEVTGFHGPFELLLGLIEKRELFVNDISLAQVTDDYIAYIQDRERIPVGETVEFLATAATLLLIKSRSLLPSIELTQEEEEDIRDLERRLHEYREIRRAARLLHKRWGSNYLYPQGRTVVAPYTFAPSKDTTRERVIHAAHTLVGNLPQLSRKKTARVQKQIHLDEMIARLAERLETAASDTFNNLTRNGTKIEAIVSFLALLELVKRDTVSVAQQEHFEDIHVEHNSNTYA